MMKRATIADVARAAGVGVATVDRLLNGRGGVSEETTRRVIAAAEAVGYHAAPLMRYRAAETLPRRVYGFVLQKREDVFFRSIAAELVAAVARAPGIRGECVIEFVDKIDPAAIAAALRRVGASAHAIGCVAIDHPIVSAAVAELAERGVPVFALLSEMSGAAVAGYVGLDSHALGRSAAWFIHRTAPRPGLIALLVGSHRYLGHHLSEIGFRSYFRESGGVHRLLETAVNLDDPEVAYAATTYLLDTHADLVGLYDAGGGREGIIAALRERGSGRDIAVVCNEITPVTREALLDGTITFAFALPMRNFAAAVVEELTAPIPSPRGTVKRMLPFDIYMQENVMAYPPHRQV